MKRFLKSSFSIFLAITIIFSSAIVGLNEIDFSGIKFENPFAVKSKAASSGTCGDNLTWKLDDTGTLTISGTGDMYDYSYYYGAFSPWYGKQINTVVINSGVTGIGKYAFSGCTSLASVTICDGVKTIGQYAFQSCTSLTSIVIPDSVTSIEYQAFNACTSLTSVEIGSNVTNINGGAFSGCTSLEAITVDPANEYYCSIDGVLFNKDATKIIKYPQNKTESTYIIPDSVKIIGVSAFYGTSLTSIELPASVNSIGDSAFSSCTSLTSIEIPGSVKSIGERTFNNCTSLTSIAIPDSITSIGRSAFEECSSLESVYIDSIDSWCNIHFSYDYDDGYYYFDYSNPLCCAENLYINGELAKDIVIPDGVTKINEFTFYGYANLTSITIPDSVTSIGYSAFRSCSSLTSITIPDSVTSIGYSAFRSCSSLVSLTIGKGVKSIGGYAFSGCTSLKSVYIDDIAAWCEISFARNHDWDYIQDSFGYSNPLYYADNLYVKGKLAKDVVIPDGVTTISDYAFWGYDLTSIRIPVSVTSVGYCAFWCNVGHVYYEGSTEQWKEIFFASGNGNLRKATRTKPQCSKPKLKSATNMKSGVKITWSKVAFADSYRVYRKVKGGDWKYLDNTKNTSFIDKTAKSGTKYYYSVRAKNNAGVTERSSSLSIKRLSFSKASKVSNTSSGIKVTWKKVTGASYYIVYRKTKGGKWDAIKKTSKLYYTDTKAKSGKTYLYTVRACNGSERSYYDTDGLSIRRLRAPKISSATSKREGILLKWNKITGASGYYVYRKVTEGEWKKIASVKGGAKIKYIDETPRKGATYQYRIKAYYGKSISYNSNTYKIKCKY